MGHGPWWDVLSILCTCENVIHCSWSSEIVRSVDMNLRTDASRFLDLTFSVPENIKLSPHTAYLARSLEGLCLLRFPICQQCPLAFYSLWAYPQVVCYWKRWQCWGQLGSFSIHLKTDSFWVMETRTLTLEALTSSPVELFKSTVSLDEFLNLLAGFMAEIPVSWLLWPAWVKESPQSMSQSEW